MKIRHKRFQRIVRWFLLSFVGFIVLILLLPLWFPLALRPVLKTAGLRYQRYERAGLSRFSIRDVVGEWNQTTLKARQVECVLPTTWLWEKYVRRTNALNQLIVHDGVLTVPANTNAASANEKGSAGGVLDSVANVANLLRRVLMKAQLTNCAVEAAGTSFTIPTAEWENGTLRGDLKSPKLTNDVALTVHSALNSMAIEIALHPLGPPPSQLAAETAVAGIAITFRRDAARWVCDGQVTWMSNHVQLAAILDTNSWWPESARVDASEFRLPAEIAGLKGYQDLQASLVADVVSNRFELQATGFALPLTSAANTNLPRVEASLRAQGDSEVAKLEQLHITMPWLRAELTNTVSIKRNGELLNNQAQLQIALNLDELPGGKIRGGASGEVIVEARDTQHPAARVDLTCTNIYAGPAHFRAVALRGEFAWPMFELETLKAEFADGSTFNAGASVNVLSNEVTEAKWQLSGGVLRQFVSGLTYDHLEASGRLRGAFTNLSHTGELKMTNPARGDVRLGGAELKWRGKNLNFDSLRIEATNSEGALLIEGRLDGRAIAQRAINGTIEIATLRRTNETLLALQRPFAFAFRAAESDTAQVQIGEAEWRGGEREVGLSAIVDWPSRGDIRLHASQISSQDIPFLNNPRGGSATLLKFSHVSQWTNGPVRSKTELVVRLQDKASGKVDVTGLITSGDFIEITNFSVATDTAPPFTMNGRVPVQIVPGRTNGWLVADETREVSLQANWLAGDREFSIPLGPLGELRVAKPTLQARASGALDEATAGLSISAASVDVQSAKTNVLSRTRIGNLRINGEITRGLLAVREFNAEVDGQPIHAWGECKLDPRFWEHLISEHQPPDWRQARGQLQIRDANVAALANYLPAVLAPEGKVTLDIALAAGGEFSGEFLLTNAATRPFGNFTPLREITAQIKLAGSRATLESFQGDIGGRPLRATGYVLIPWQRPLEYRLNLLGTNVPLARSLELLLRGDVDLELRGGETNTTLTGKVNLHDGLFVQHATSLFESGPKRPELRPPYFSVTNEPFADWKLDLAVQGSRFLRVQTPVFNGTLSANLAVKGPLREPVISGDARVDEGRIIFPFGGLRVEQGYATLTGNDPRGPDILLNASGRNFDYDLHLEAKGPADGADITFSSTPPLNSEEILLMLTAGELPQNSYAFSTTSKAGKLATFLGRDVMSRYTGGGSGESRLTITSGENISQEGKLTYSVEYKLTDRWSVIGEYDRFSAVNAEVKWKIISR